MRSWLLMLLLAGLPVTAAEVVEVTAPVIVYDRSDPGFCVNCRGYQRVELTDPARLAALDGVGPRELFSEYLVDGSDQEQALSAVVSGGELRLAVKPGQARPVATVTYGSSRILAVSELETLVEYTRGQLLDGIGEGFTQSGTPAQQAWVEFEVLYPELVSVRQRPALASVTSETSSMPSATPAHAPRTDGVYQLLMYPGGQREEGRVLAAEYRYVRFYSDGTVLTATTTAAPGQLATWFNPAHEHLMKGRYTVSVDGALTFTARYKGLAIDHQGRVEGGMLSLAARLYDTGFEPPRDYRFVPLPDGETQD